MIYVLAHPCEHKDHKGKCDEIAYLFEESDGESEDDKKKIIKEFISKCDAEKYIETNNWNPEHIMIMPIKEMIMPKEEMGE